MGVEEAMALVEVSGRTESSRQRQMCIRDSSSQECVCQKEEQQKMMVGMVQKLLLLRKMAKRVTYIWNWKWTHFSRENRRKWINDNSLKPCLSVKLGRLLMS